MANRFDILRKKVEDLFAANRVEVTRTWTGSDQKYIFHAPSLCSSTNRSFFDILATPFREMVRPWKVCYPHQWFWDSCAHAIVLTHIDPALARAEIEALLNSQNEEGFIAHMIWNHNRMHWLDNLSSRFYPSKYTSPYLQPPILAEAVEAIYLKENKLEYLIGVLPRLKKYYEYLHRTRDRSHDGLLEIIISYESGKDRSPEYDELYETKLWPLPIIRLVNTHRRLGWDIDLIMANNSFRVKDLLFNCVYAQNLRSLSRLCSICNDADSSEYQERAGNTEASILTKMHDTESGLFFSVDARSGKEKQLRVVTVSTLLPLMLDTITQDQVERLVKEYLANPRQFWTEYPVPAEPVQSPERKKPEIWRGQQTWVYTNWFVVKGLRKQAKRFPAQVSFLESVADSIVEKTYDLVEKQGFREYYDSREGKGCRALNFGWSTLVLDMIYNR